MQTAARLLNAQVPLNSTSITHNHFNVKMANPQDEIERIFSTEEYSKRIIHLSLDPSMSRPKRKQILQLVPKILRSNRHLMRKELQENGYYEMDHRPHYIDTLAGLLPLARLFGALEFNRWDG